MFLVLFVTCIKFKAFWLQRSCQVHFMLPTLSQWLAIFCLSSVNDIIVSWWKGWSIWCVASWNRRSSSSDWDDVPSVIVKLRWIAPSNSRIVGPSLGQVQEYSSLSPEAKQKTNQDKHSKRYDWNFHIFYIVETINITYDENNVILMPIWFVHVRNVGHRLTNGFIWNKKYYWRSKQVQ